MKLAPRISEALVASVDERVILAALDNAKSLVACGAGYGVDSAEDVREGAHFRIPLLIPEEVKTGDNRKFKSGAITLGELPIPLLWQEKTGAGHDGSYVVGRIDSIE